MPDSDVNVPVVRRFCENPECLAGLNPDEKYCWRCGGTNIQEQSPTENCFVPHNYSIESVLAAQA